MHWLDSAFVILLQLEPAVQLSVWPDSSEDSFNLMGL